MNADLKKIIETEKSRLLDNLILHLEGTCGFINYEKMKGTIENIELLNRAEMAIDVLTFNK